VIDLFDAPCRPIPRNIGHGNAALLADIANGATRAQLTANRKAGKYPDLYEHAGRWLKLAGVK
jgi:hypothetical protein